MKRCKVEVFDPPMCCSSGVCGPNVDTELVSFSRSLDWLRKQGVDVDRYNLSTHPAAFVAHELVKQELIENGTERFPLIAVNGLIIHKGSYPDRETLANLCGMAVSAGQSG